MEQKFENNVERIDFDSMTECAEFACRMGTGLTTQGAKVGDYWAKGWSASKGVSAKQVLASLSNVSSELVSKVEEMRERIENLIDVPTKKRRVRKNKLDMGDELDPIAWVQRDPDGWSEMRKVHSPKRVIRIGVNVVTSSGLPEYKLIPRGAAAVALAEAMEAKGHHVELVAFWAVTNMWSNARGERHVITVPIKKLDRPMNISAAAVAVCDVAYSRAVMMGAIARATKGLPTDGFGMPASLYADEKSGLDMIIDQDIMSEERAVEAVKNAVKNVSENPSAGE